MKSSSVKGTNDYLPGQARLRDYLQGIILETYQSCGFERIMTPAIEDMENLDKSEGGENLNLLFKILKRGDKLTKALEQQKFDELSDIGLRYDLTLPLTRYYSAHKNDLMTPFKVIQIDKVYRAERPQKGRLREFVQCDIDILGSDSWHCEVELIDTTAKALLKIGMKDFKIKINDRRLLKNILTGIGFLADQLDSICISLDKLDKIGVDGIREELLGKELEAEKVEKLLAVLADRPFTLEKVAGLCDDQAVIENLTNIMEQAGIVAKGRYQIELDITLVRGQGYYTGTIFEVESPHFKGAIAGGGRYDNLVGKFLNESVPAVGFSIGFERIFAILSETGYQIPDQKKRIGVLYSSNELVRAMEYADSLREQSFAVSLFEKPKKVGKLINRIEQQGYDGFADLGEGEPVIKYLQGRED